MKILYVHYLNHPQSMKGGPSVHIQSCTNALHCLGHQVAVLEKQPLKRGQVLTPSPRSSNRLRQCLARYGYEPRALLRSFRHIKREFEAIKCYQPDVVIARYEAFEYSIFLVTKYLQIPLIWEVNGTSSEISQWNTKLFLYPLTDRMENYVLSKADSVFVVSKELKALLIDGGLPPALITVIPNGADPSRFHPGIGSQDLRRHYGLSEALVVGFLGSFFQWHDITTMIEIIPLILRHNPHVYFLLAGAQRSDLAPALRAKLRGFEERVILPGVISIDDAPKFLALMDIALALYPPMQPFYFSPIKLFEYMAAGLPIVASAIGQQAAVIQDGMNGLLTIPGDVDDVRAKVQRLIDDPGLRHHLGVEARKTLLDNYTWEHNAQRISHLCEQAIQKTRYISSPSRQVNG